jgi:hypothetical protein
MTGFGFLLKSGGLLLSPALAISKLLAKGCTSSIPLPGDEGQSQAAER